ncbi:transposase [Streptomyces sp. NPDC046853]|uniref:transposase n=1 Tax=Streptomyces sp. NPDC046853 TaxID=3154920 RepID=UPI0033DA31EA
MESANPTLSARSWPIDAALHADAREGRGVKAGTQGVAVRTALAYRLRAGCACRLLPHDLPPWPTVYHHWRLWQQEGQWERMLTALRT